MSLDRRYEGNEKLFFTKSTITTRAPGRASIEEKMSKIKLEAEAVDFVDFLLKEGDKKK